ncbi:hypothetical protein B0H34DRAFT_805932 [Crassisporium funariophilum]|nr:hypothetical protein B0H34DRAFT_805932 [Crassisporium funariophilum]
MQGGSRPSSQLMYRNFISGATPASMVPHSRNSNRGLSQSKSQTYKSLTVNCHSDDPFMSPTCPLRLKPPPGLRQATKKGPTFIRLTQYRAVHNNRQSPSLRFLPSCPTIRARKGISGRRETPRKIRSLTSPISNAPPHVLYPPSGGLYTSSPHRAANKRLQKVLLSAYNDQQYPPLIDEFRYIDLLATERMEWSNVVVHERCQGTAPEIARANPSPMHRPVVPGPIQDFDSIFRLPGNAFTLRWREEQQRSAATTDVSNQAIKHGVSYLRMEQSLPRTIRSQLQRSHGPFKIRSTQRCQLSEEAHEWLTRTAYLKIERSRSLNAQPEVWGFTVACRVCTNVIMYVRTGGDIGERTQR